MKKSELLSVRVTKVEKKALEQLANDAGAWQTSKLVREMIQEGLQRRGISVELSQAPRVQ